MRSLRVGVLLTHPVQYYAPLFRELAARDGIELKVFYAHRPTSVEQGEGFGVAFTWDVDVTSGYDHEFLPSSDRGEADRPTYDTPSIGERIKEGAFDAFIVFGWHARTYWQAMRACWAQRVPVFVRGDSQLGMRDRGLRGILKSITYPRFVGRFAACLATGSRSEAYFTHYGARRVVLSPHFVDNDWFAERARQIDPAAARRSFGLPEDGLVVLFAGKLVDRKRPQDVIEAAVDAGRRISVLIAGDGERRAECEAAAERAGNAGVAVAFAGFLNQGQLPAAYVASDLLALPSNDLETWGLVVNEAMACGRAAVVSAAVGCAPDLIVEGRTGHVHADGDTAALAHVLRRCAEDVPGTRRMGELARERIAEFTPAVAADAVVRALRETPELSAR